MGSSVLSLLSGVNQRFFETAEGGVTDNRATMSKKSREVVNLTPRLLERKKDQNGELRNEGVSPRYIRPSDQLVCIVVHRCRMHS